MRSKHIAALITFFATFAFSAFIALLFATPKIPYVPPVNTYEFKSYSNDSRTCKGSKIKAFLVQDKQNGQELDRYRLSYEDGFVSRSSMAVFANAVSEYVSESSSMNDNRFPRDFQIAWREHMQAWSNYEEFLQESKTQYLTFEDFNSDADRYTDEISSTWQETLRIAREHGAELHSNF